MSKLVQVIIACAPVLLTPLVVYLLAEGFVDFGGGEKDILLVLPWLIWSLAFALCAIVLIIRGWYPARWVRRSAILSTVVVVALAAVAYGASWLGLAARR